MRQERSGLPNSYRNEVAVPGAGDGDTQCCRMLWEGGQGLALSLWASCVTAQSPAGALRFPGLVITVSCSPSNVLVLGWLPPSRWQRWPSSGSVVPGLEPQLPPERDPLALLGVTSWHGALIREGMRSTTSQREAAGLFTAPKLWLECRKASGGSELPPWAFGAILFLGLGRGSGAWG